MRVKGIFKTIAASFLLCSLLCGSFVHATLGDRPLKAFRKRLNARSNYTVHVVQTEGTEVREFVSADGRVFGVAWNGIAPPDLDSLLGNYSAEYKRLKNEKTRMRGYRHHAIRASDLVVEQWGHMRNLQGRAFDPALVPPGMDANEIK